MINNTFFNFLSLLLIKQKNKHIAVFIISILLVSILSSVLFISDAIKVQRVQNINFQSDFIVQKIRSGDRIDISESKIDKFLELRGVSSAKCRIYGKYYPSFKNSYFTIIGVDLFDEEITNELKSIFKNLDIGNFLKEDNMIIGESVKKYLNNNYYTKNYNFITPTGIEKNVHIYKTFNKKTTLNTNNLIIMSNELAKEILGIKPQECSDITIDVPNDAERNNVLYKLQSMYFDTKIIEKREIINAYNSMFNYKGGFFLILFTLSLITFMLILYQRYSMINSSDKKEIAILRAIGWSIKDVLKLKIYENLTILISAFLTGVAFGYIYVFIFNAPVLKDIFMGNNPLENTEIFFQPQFNFGVFISLFLFFIIPTIVAVLIPVWKIAITDPNEAMR
jgi:ABC-type lipoprotein release transport system permease subunit